MKLASTFQVWAQLRLPLESDLRRVHPADKQVDVISVEPGGRDPCIAFAEKLERLFSTIHLEGPYLPSALF